MDAVYSRKHYLRGYKVEGLVLPNGQAVSCTQRYPDNEADIEIFQKHTEFHMQALRKAKGDDDIENEGRLIARYPTSWSVLADKGYQELDCDFRAVTSYQCSASQKLTLDQISTNKRIAHDRILVENYFGCLCSVRRCR